MFEKTGPDCLLARLTVDTRAYLDYSDKLRQTSSHNEVHDQERGRRM